jgi:violaxanthin de-epoxidase
MKMTKKSLLSLLIATSIPRLSTSFAPSHPSVQTRHASSIRTENLLVQLNALNDNNGNFIEQAGKATTAALLALSLSFSSLPVAGPLQPTPANAADGAAIGLCLLNKCRVPLAKCILNPNCLANVICINSCNGKPDETGCQIECGNVFENEAVGEFNKCAVSDMTCVPQKPDDGSYPVPSKDVLVQSFDTKLWNGRWYITAGQNKLFDTFPCQVHFFTEVSCLVQRSISLFMTFTT